MHQIQTERIFNFTKWKLDNSTWTNWKKLNKSILSDNSTSTIQYKQTELISITIKSKEFSLFSVLIYGLVTNIYLAS